MVVVNATFLVVLCEALLDLVALGLFFFFALFRHPVQLLGCVFELAVRAAVDWSLQKAIKIETVSSRKGERCEKKFGGVQQLLVKAAHPALVVSHGASLFLEERATRSTARAWLSAEAAVEPFRFLFAFFACKASLGALRHCWPPSILVRRLSPYGLR